MPIKKLDVPCWELASPEDAPHFADEDELREWYDDRTIPADAKLRQLERPCSYLQCDECGAVFDQEADGYIAHLKTQSDANFVVFQSEWTVAEGKVYCLAEDCQESAEAAGEVA